MTKAFLGELIAEATAMAIIIGPSTQSTSNLLPSLELQATTNPGAPGLASETWGTPATLFKA